MWGKSADTIVHERFPFNAEAAASALARDEITALDVFYCRNHGPIPDILADDWHVDVDGLVANPLRISFDQLTSRFKKHRVVATLQCAGNRRAGFNEIREIAGEDPWGPGATSTAEWHGARLADVLDAAGTRRNDLHAAFVAPDVSPLASPAQPFGGSIALAKAMSDEVLLAWQMNDQPLPRIHGGPVRVLVPGYIGARSVKWVSGITVQETPSRNYFQAFAYRILPPDCDPDRVGADTGISLSAVALNCDILVPDDGAHVAAGPLTIRGYAFTGDDHRVARVEVSLDDGRTWCEAKLAPAQGRWAWRHWTLTVDARPGPLSVTARAWDTAGTTQPESAAELWNPKGYANNAWARVRVEVSEPAGYWADG
ncbi:sulfite oxidase [Herpetosiphon aurantiacus DSM 785] [Mycobacterium shimoidei]|uniref:Sulfite oxidase [Herpetosiphon aurantiacus DSM 785] n=1 Tax=Mycobacterium shimoidei TaxID=29313 RepID=A0A375YZE5_MYCSH|nr:sulfite oxidase [Mycobacterium shimoidei]SRX94259.1 sulfite oxidase [Herpetosiphon aurantiacus DSM 785] [Mycobacterium shimoidei]